MAHSQPVTVLVWLDPLHSQILLSDAPNCILELSIHSVQTKVSDAQPLQKVPQMEHTNPLNSFPAGHVHCPDTYCWSPAHLQFFSSVSSNIILLSSLHLVHFPVCMSHSAHLSEQDTQLPSL
ncbi:unnamed protein product [Blepharisma stoltei]|uniref:Uncharacterized protein n=1 Tax=Blepharisma stoltei TaxID=1481888 RepID=A0AAU9JK96_9CILI|nr:unnamed protein product [Blepharisma stoltei]